jgi:hypothetical protein
LATDAWSNVNQRNEREGVEGEEVGLRRTKRDRKREKVLGRKKLRFAKKN